MNLNLETIIILALATYRLSLLISKEQGPFDIFGKFRDWAGIKFDAYSNPVATGQLSEAIICPYCLSVWVGICATLGLAVAHAAGVEKYYLLVLLPFALSGLAVFFFKWAGV